MQTLSLSGSWQLSSKDGVFSFSEATVPGSFFFELEKSGYWGDHDINFRENNRQGPELASRDFLYEKSFDLPAGFFGSDRRIFLEADGLDTLAELALNEKTLGTADNMHRRWIFPIDDFAKEGRNRLAITFFDAVKEANRRQDQRQLWQVGTPLRGAMHLRKNFCSFGWDWGPQIPDVGLYRDIRIKSYLGARLTDVDIRQEHAGDKVSLKAHAHLERWSNRPLEIAMTLKHPDGRVETYRSTTGDFPKIEIQNPQLWWPNGYGDQPLYDLKLTLTVQGEEVDQRHTRIGLRTLKLVREKDVWGESFYFAVNGTSIFARGANYIPEDIYLTRATPEKTRKLLESVRDANMNCLRIWGGGIYPHDHFFDLCDELGIIIWQDMMFSCAIYDIHNESFALNITEEIKDVLRRIRHHPSLGLICGNNEMEWAFEHWNFPHTKEHRVEYIKQYEILIPALVKEWAPTVDYWPASPSSGGHFDQPNDPDRGDVHYWDVWHGRKSYKEFRKHYFRFLSEFGFQSFPNIKTINSYTLEEDRNIFSPVMEDHQRNESENGNAKIFHFISDYYRYPKDFANVVYVSQLSQAEALRYAVEHLRQFRGRCMGATYWQLNDNWPVASWSSIDYFGRWKAMHYMAKRVYDPLLLCIREEGTSAALFLCNEQKSTIHGRVAWKLQSLSGEIIRQGEQMVEVSPLSAVSVAELDFAADLKGTEMRSHYLSASFVDQNKSLRRYANAAFVPYKHLNLTNPAIVWHIDEDSEHYVIHVRATRSFAKFVELDLAEGDCVFSDNYFDLDAGQERPITVRKQQVSRQVLESQLRIKSLIDSF